MTTATAIVTREIKDKCVLVVRLQMYIVKRYGLVEVNYEDINGNK